MRTETVLRAITLTIAVVLALIAINLQAYVVPPLLSADSAGVAERRGDDEGAEPGPYLIELSFYSQFCPC